MKPTYEELEAQLSVSRTIIDNMLEKGYQPPKITTRKNIAPYAVKQGFTLTADEINDITAYAMDEAVKDRIAFDEVLEALKSIQEWVLQHETYLPINQNTNAAKEKVEVYFAWLRELKSEFGKKSIQYHDLLIEEKRKVHGYKLFSDPEGAALFKNAHAVIQDHLTIVIEDHSRIQELADTFNPMHEDFVQTIRALKKGRGVNPVKLFIGKMAAQYPKQPRKTYRIGNLIHDQLKKISRFTITPEQLEAKHKLEEFAGDNKGLGIYITEAIEIYEKQVGK